MNLGAWQDLRGGGWSRAPPRMHIPYAATLARRDPSCSRPPPAGDFPNVLALIRAHALLRRATRTVENGVITATIADYGELPGCACSERLCGGGGGMGLSVASIRETVQAVIADLTTIGTDATVLKVAEALDLDEESAASSAGGDRRRGRLHPEPRGAGGGGRGRACGRGCASQDVSNHAVPSETLSGTHGCGGRGGANTKAAQHAGPRQVRLKSTPSNRNCNRATARGRPSRERDRPERAGCSGPRRRPTLCDRRGSLGGGAGCVQRLAPIPAATPSCSSQMPERSPGMQGSWPGRAPLQLGPGIRLDDVERSVRVDTFRSAHQEGCIGRGCPPRPARLLFSLSWRRDSRWTPSSPKPRWLPPDQDETMIALEPGVPPGEGRAESRAIAGLDPPA